MRSIVISGQYKKDLKLARKRNLPESELNEVIYKLACDIPLDPDKRDHALTGNLSGLRECHIKPDWLLVYRVEENDLILLLMRTGTHADVLGM